MRPVCLRAGRGRLQVCPRSGRCAQAGRPPGTYLRVLSVAPVHLGQALAGGLAGGGRGEGLLHLAGAVLEASLDTVGFVELVYLPEARGDTREVSPGRAWTTPRGPLAVGPTLWA